MVDEAPKTFRRVRAFHPHWTGALLLSQTDGEVRHEGAGSSGTYRIEEHRLHVAWDRHAPERFHCVQGAYYHEAITSNLPEIGTLQLVAGAGIPLRLSRIALHVPTHPYEVSLRIGTSDVATFHQVFLAREYDAPELPEHAGTIVDLGGNIGLGTVFFGLRYPAARLLSVEPDPGNFALLEANTRALGDRVRAREAAVWIRDGAINFHTETEDGRDLEAWGGQVSEASGHGSRPTPCSTLATLLDEARFDTVDILKVDIEGAELELFSQGADAWLDRVALIIVETHDRFRPGSEDAVRAALAGRFRELPRLGENLLFRRV